VFEFGIGLDALSVTFGRVDKEKEVVVSTGELSSPLNNDVEVLLLLFKVFWYIGRRRSIVVDVNPS
jgi:hypothetical protein